MSINQVYQVLPGARKPTYHSLYVLGGVVTAPSASVGANADADTVTLSGGTIEFDGRSFSLNSLALDFGTLGSLVASGQRFIISAVPSYLEPADRSAAVSAGVRYFVEYDANREAIARPFIDPAAVDAVNALGGISNVRERVLNGIASSAEVIAFNNYELERSNFTDRRFAPEVLLPTGVRFILDQIVPQSNAPSSNALETMSATNIANLQAQIPEFPARRVVLAKAAAVARYNTAARTILIKPGTAFHFSSEANANTGTGGTAVADINNINAASGTHIALFEYYMPSNTDRAQVGNEPAIVRRLTASQSSVLGRVNPLYLENKAPMVKVPQPDSFSRLTKWADPVNLLDVSLGSNLAITINNTIYQRLY